MKDKLVKKMQKHLIEISFHSVGRSIPMGVYEKEIPAEVLKLYKKMGLFD